MWERLGRLGSRGLQAVWQFDLVEEIVGGLITAAFEDSEGEEVCYLATEQGR